jgi:DNA-binding LacI/PurR family transcriptional regulator
VPQRVSVVGFDDLPAAPMFAPPLTTVRQDIVKIGQHAARNLLRSLKGREVPHVTIIPTQLVVRDSSAPPRVG